MEHYKFKAMQKVLEGVGRSNHFLKRPKFEKFKEIAGNMSSSEKVLSEVDREIRNLTVLIRKIKNNPDVKKASEIVREMVAIVDLKSVEALGTYLVAWQLLKKEILKKQEEEKAENKEEEKSEKQEEEKSERQEEEKSEKQEQEDIEGEDLCKSLMMSYYQDRLEENEESSLLFEALNLAEEAEQILMEVEKTMANILNDNPLEG